MPDPSLKDGSHHLDLQRHATRCLEFLRESLRLHSQAQITRQSSSNPTDDASYDTYRTRASNPQHGHNPVLLLQHEEGLVQWEGKDRCSSNSLPSHSTNSSRTSNSDLSEIIFGDEDATEIFLSQPTASTYTLTRTESSTNVTLVASLEHWRDWQNVSIPHHSEGLTTFAYQQALHNRVHSVRLCSKARYDVATYNPVFIYDCLMLPGSLANILDGKHTVPACVSRMTPAILPGFHAHVSPSSTAPIIQPSSQPQDFVRGMLIFGLGRASRRHLKIHYHRQLHRSIQAGVLADVVVDIPNARPDLERRVFAADVFVSEEDYAASAGDESSASHDPGKPWTLEEYLAGTLTDVRPEPLVVDLHGVVESTTDPGGAERDDDVVAPPTWDVVYGGAPTGTVEYEIGEGFMGW